MSLTSGLEIPITEPHISGHFNKLNLTIHKFNKLIKYIYNYQKILTRFHKGYTAPSCGNPFVSPNANQILKPSKHVSLVSEKVGCDLSVAKNIS